MGIYRLTALCCLTILPAGAQWLDYPTKGIPRTTDGKPNLTAPAPKTPDGKPDLAGLWLGDQWAPAGRRPNPPGNTRSAAAGDASVGAESIRRTHGPTDQGRSGSALHAAGRPQSHHAAVSVRNRQRAGKTVMLFEMYSLRRQIFTDGRELPKEFIESQLDGLLGR